jgi:bile acid:Na+ symporter, BASS family
MKLIETWFWAFCVAAALIGLLIPQVILPLAGGMTFLLGSILFFTGLKLDYAAAWREIKRPGVVIYGGIVRLVVLPLAIYAAARLVLPGPLAVGVLIVAAMPSGTACSSLTDVVRGNAALALVGTVVTSLACPFVAPWIIGLASGHVASGGLPFLLKQASFLAVVLFVPLGIALLLRRAFPRGVLRHANTWSVMAMVSLFLLICVALASASDSFKALVDERPGQAVGLFIFMSIMSAAFHVVGYCMAPWRSTPDRAALSVNMAYVNNSLAIVFAMEFFQPLEALGAAAVLPAIFLEIPMALMLIPLKAWVARHARGCVRSRTIQKSI